MKRRHPLQEPSSTLSAAAPGADGVAQGSSEPQSHASGPCQGIAIALRAAGRGPHPLVVAHHELELESRIRRLFYGEHWRVGTIATQLGLHHDKVERVLGLHERKPKAPRKWAVEPYLDFIRATLEMYPTLTGTRVFEMIRARGYKREVAQVRRAIRRWNLRPKAPAPEAFLSLRMLPGEMAQVDWAHLGYLERDGTRLAVWALIFVLCYSRDSFIYFSHTQKMEAVVAGHLGAFTCWGGVPRQMVYDGMKTAVLERQGRVVRFHPTLLEMAGHFAFEPVACRPRRASDKGRVERRVRYLRSSLLAGRSFRSLQDYRDVFKRWRTEVLHARPWSDDKTRTVGEATAAELGALMPLPHNPRAFSVLDTASVGKQPYVRFGGNRYTVPPACVRRMVTLDIEPERLRVLDRGVVVAEHARCWGRGRTIENPAHLEALRAQRARGSERSGRGRLLDAVPEAEKLLLLLAARHEALSPQTRQLLALLDHYGPTALTAAVAEAIERGTPRACSVRWLVEQAADKSPPAPPVELPDRDDVRQQSIPSATLEIYDVFNRKSKEDE